MVVCLSKVWNKEQWVSSKKFYKSAELECKNVNAMTFDSLPMLLTSCFFSFIPMEKKILFVLYYKYILLEWSYRKIYILSFYLTTNSDMIEQNLV